MSIYQYILLLYRKVNSILIILTQSRNFPKSRLNMPKNPFTRDALRSYPWYLLIEIFSYMILVLIHFAQTNKWLSNSITTLYLIGLYLFVKNILSKKLFHQSGTGFFKFKFKVTMIFYLFILALVYCVFHVSLDRHLIDKLTLLIIINGVLTAFCTSVNEELIFRHVLLSNFIYFKKPVLIPILISSVCFAMVHQQYSGTEAYAPYFVYVFLHGCFFGLLYWTYKNIWLNISVHFAINSYGNVFDAHSPKIDSPLFSIFPYQFILPFILLAILFLLTRRRLENRICIHKLLD
jgi:membrane protease YdiL (CAAX protease family)